MMLETFVILGLLVLLLGAVVMFAKRAEGSLSNGGIDGPQDRRDALTALEPASQAERHVY